MNKILSKSDKEIFLLLHGYHKIKNSERWSKQGIIIPCNFPYGWNGWSLDEAYKLEVNYGN